MQADGKETHHKLQQTIYVLLAALVMFIVIAVIIIGLTVVPQIIAQPSFNSASLTK